MTIKFFSNYATSAELLKRFLANYSVWDVELKFTIAENYNFAVVFNRTDEFINRNAKIITVIQEPSWSPAHTNTSFLTGSDYPETSIWIAQLLLKISNKLLPNQSVM